MHILEEYHLVVTTMVNTCTAHHCQDFREGNSQGIPLVLPWLAQHASIRGIVTLMSNS